MKSYTVIVRTPQGHQTYTAIAQHSVDVAVAAVDRYPNLTGLTVKRK